MFNLPFKKQEPERTIGLDVGTKAVKGLVLKNDSVLAHSFRYLDKYSAFKGDFFEGAVIKRAMKKVLEDLKRQTDVESQQCFLLLPPNILKARTADLEVEREEEGAITDREKEEIGDEILSKAKKEVATRIGALESDIYSKHWKVLERSIDGYEVPNLIGFKGNNIRLKILTVFFLKNYFEKIREIRDFLEHKITFIHPVQGLLHISENSTIPPSGVFLDIGGKVTQLFVVNEKELIAATDFNSGGNNFTMAISEELGLTESRARVLKERYSRSQLSEETAKGIEEILSGIEKNWSSRAIEKLKSYGTETLPNDIYLFGAGSYLSALQESLEENLEKTSFLGKPKLKFLYPEQLEFKNTKELGVQFTPLLLALSAQ